MRDEPCCAECTGQAPYFICRTKHSCMCHQYRDLMAQKKHKASSHRDPTANMAVRNVTRKSKK